MSNAMTTVVLDDEEVEEILRIRDVYETPWEQLALDEGCDPDALREAVQEWEAGQGGIVVASVVPQRRRQGPEVHRRRAARQSAYQRKRIEDARAAALERGEQLTRKEILERLRAKAQADRVETAKRRDRLRQVAEEALGGVDVWCARAGEQRTAEQREALYRVCALLRAEGATLADVRAVLGAPRYVHKAGLTDAYHGRERVKPPVGGGKRGAALAVLRRLGCACCAWCLAAELGGEKADLARDAVDTLARRGQGVERVEACEHPAHRPSARRRRAWRATP